MLRHKGGVTRFVFKGKDYPILPKKTTFHRDWDSLGPIPSVQTPQNNFSPLGKNKIVFYKWVETSDW